MVGRPRREMKKVEENGWVDVCYSEWDDAAWARKRRDEKENEETE
jgi:hypothetical protein